MKTISASQRFAFAAAFAVTLGCIGCEHFQPSNDLQKKPIPPASIGAASSGIGGSGGDSADTRAVGTVATGEGNSDETQTGVTPATAVPRPYTATGSGTH